MKAGTETDSRSAAFDSHNLLLPQRRYSALLSRTFALTRLCLSTAFILVGLIAPAFAQEREHEEDKKPVYVTVRVFQGRVNRGSTPDPTDQTFKLNTRAQTDYEKWIASLSKAYPGFEIAQVRTELLRIFPSPNPGRVIFGPRNGRNLQLLVNVAYSPGDGVTPGLNLIPMVEYHFGDEKTDKKYPPVMQAFPVPIDVEEGMTYFFTHKSLSYSPESYVNFVRPGASPGDFGSSEYFFIFALTKEPFNPAQPGGEKPTARVFNDKQSAELQANAVKKVEPEWPDDYNRPGFDGRIQVRVEIGPDGRVAHAGIWNSSLPEANHQAIAAARQWQFPATLFAESRLPVYATLTFEHKSPEAKPAPAPQPAPATAAPDKTSPARAAPAAKRPVRPKK